MNKHVTFRYKLARLFHLISRKYIPFTLSLSKDCH